jgi:flavin reductase (DIM6/NTAB) family NADH-FMN oxidoreductase RutF
MSEGSVGTDKDLFREVFGHFATGVAVITTAGPTRSGGMTANALCSLSLDPMLVLICFEHRARTLPIVREHGRFAINILASDQRDVARTFASKLPEADKLVQTPHRLHDGAPIIDGAHAWAVCELQQEFEGGDHTIAIGRVLHLGLGGGEPLIWYEGGYRALA